jgi:DNA adenine methylase
MSIKQLAIPPLVGAIHELPLPKVGTRVDMYMIKSSFLSKEFELDSQRELSELALKPIDRSIYVNISNHDSEFTRSIYTAAKLNYFDVQRFISSKASNRTKAPELLAIFSKK